MISRSRCLSIRIFWNPLWILHKYRLNIKLFVNKLKKCGCQLSLLYWMYWFPSNWVLLLKKWRNKSKDKNTCSNWKCNENWSILKRKTWIKWLKLQSFLPQTNTTNKEFQRYIFLNKQNHRLTCRKRGKNQPFHVFKRYWLNKNMKWIPGKAIHWRGSKFQTKLRTTIIKTKNNNFWLQMKEISK